MDEPLESSDSLQLWSVRFSLRQVPEHLTFLGVVRLSRYRDATVVSCGACMYVSVKRVGVSVQRSKVHNVIFLSKSG